MGLLSRRPSHCGACVGQCPGLETLEHLISLKSVWQLFISGMCLDDRGMNKTDMSLVPEALGLRRGGEVGRKLVDWKMPNIRATVSVVRVRMEGKRSDWSETETLGPQA